MSLDFPLPLFTPVFSIQISGIDGIICMQPLAEYPNHTPRSTPECLFAFSLFSKRQKSSTVEPDCTSSFLAASQQP